MNTQTFEKSMRERYAINMITDKQVVELFWRKKNGTLPKPTTFLERLIDRIKK